MSDRFYMSQVNGKRVICDREDNETFSAANRRYSMGADLIVLLNSLDEQIKHLQNQEPGPLEF